MIQKRQTIIYSLNKKGAGLKILTPTQIFQRLPIAFAQVKAGNNSKNLLKEIRLIFYSLLQSKEITKKYTITIKSIQLLKMDTVFMNSNIVFINSLVELPNLMF